MKSLKSNPKISVATFFYFEASTVRFDQWPLKMFTNFMFSITR